MQCVFAFYLLTSCTGITDALFAKLPCQMVTKVAYDLYDRLGRMGGTIDALVGAALAKYSV